MGLGKFNKNAGAAAAAPDGKAGGKFKAKAGGGKAAPKKSKWAGITSAVPRDPILGFGRYRLLVTGNAFNAAGKPGGSDTFRGSVTVVETDGQCENQVGDQCVVLEMLSGPGGPSGMARTKAYIMAQAGFESEEEYDEFDPDGLFIDAALGESNDFSKYTLEGRHVDVVVTKGNPTKDGNDYFRNWAWSVVEDDEQPDVPKVTEQ